MTMPRRFPKVPVYAGTPVKVPAKQKPVQQPRPLDPQAQKKKEDLLKAIHQKVADIERCLNTADYRKAYRIATGELRKYTDASIKGNDLLSRMAGMAETALEYQHAKTPPADAAFLEFLAGEMEEYKDIDPCKAVERAMVDRLDEGIAYLKSSGKPSWIPRWIQTWGPWVTPVDGDKVVRKLVDEPGMPRLKWTFKIPPSFAPGEKQQCIETRKKIADALARGSDTLKEVDRGDVAPPAPGPEPPAIHVPILEPVKTPGSLSRGVFSKKKATVDPVPAKEAPKKTPSRRFNRPVAAIPVAKDEPAFSSSDVKEKLLQYKHEGLDEVHFLKIKNDVGAYSLNQEKKLFRIMETLVQKGIVIRKKGRLYAILL